jgi:membrane glycosyltransferase
MATVSALALDSYAARGMWRRLLLFSLVGGTTSGGIWLMATILGTNGLTWAEVIVTAVFALLFAWITFSFWIAVIGLALRLVGRDPISLERTSWDHQPVGRLTSRTAVLFPIYNEDTQRVVAGISATYGSLAATGQLQHFDTFVLSDTTDPEVARRERLAWATMTQRLSAEGRLFYRHRERNTGRKAGNIADWVRRWGGGYEHMIVMDADSVMSGSTLVRLAALMEANPSTGGIQTFPIAVGRNTMFARALQFAHRLYGPALAAGQSFWQVGEANYYGHNAILRTRAFAESCGLPKLAGGPPLGGEIMSHDFVEAAFLRRRGWHFWFLSGLPGSFEEIPSNFVDYAIRDRRWAQGQMQHALVVFIARMHWVNRLHLAMATFAFLASPLWFALLLLSSFLVAEHALRQHAFFPAAMQLFPVWPEYRPTESACLLGLTATLLLLPKIGTLAFALARREERNAFGGGTKLALSALAELLLSILLAPILMLLHTSFLASILTGRAVGWVSQPRDDRGIPWPVAIRFSLWPSLVGLGWFAAAVLIAPDYLVWVAPVALGMLVSIPLVVMSSRLAPGPLFLIPEERQSIDVLLRLERGQPDRGRHVPAET